MVAARKRIRTRPYVGIRFREGLPPERVYFRSATVPTHESHGDQFAAVTGPFVTKRGAMFDVQFGYNNPHVQHVSDAERLGRQYAADYVNGRFIR